MRTMFKLMQGQKSLRGRRDHLDGTFLRTLPHFCQVFNTPMAECVSQGQLDFFGATIQTLATGLRAIKPAAYTYSISRAYRRLLLSHYRSSVPARTLCAHITLTTSGDQRLGHDSGRPVDPDYLRKLGLFLKNIPLRRVGIRGR